MIEAVENHMPQVIVIDEIGTAAEALAARTIAERGVQLIATAHGNTLENLLQNPTLSDLVGGIQAVTLSDEEARRRGTQKTVLERKAPPTFDVLIEIQDKDRLAVHHDVAEVVDRFLRDVPPRPELRVRTADGEGRDPPRRPATVRPGLPRRPRHGPIAGRPIAAAPTWPPAAAGRSPPLARAPGRRPRAPGAPPRGRAEPRRPCRRAARGQTVRIFPYAVSRDKLERAIRKFRVPAYMVEDPTTPTWWSPSRPRSGASPAGCATPRPAACRSTWCKSNTITQMENFLRSAFERRRPAGGRRRRAARGRGRHRRGPGAGPPGRARAPEQLPPPPPAPDHRALRPDLGEQGGRALPAGGDLSGLAAGRAGAAVAWSARLHDRGSRLRPWRTVAGSRPQADRPALVEGRAEVVQVVLNSAL